MDRWWSNTQDASRVLANVDDSDVVQGVGTAVLGYHALAEGVLRPLANRTLVDGQQVLDVLNAMDLAPVAKALEAATRPIMGDASGVYGQLMARELHRESVESTSRLVTNLVATGLPWPTAVDRAAGVHGVPVQRLGKAGGALRAAAMPRLVQADISDRALMDYASHVGQREDTREPVVKEEQQWREELVRRDAVGRFADRQGTKKLSAMASPASNAERKALRERRTQMKQAKENKRLEQTQRLKGASLLDVMRANTAPKVAAEQALAQVAQPDSRALAQEKAKAKLDARVKAKVDGRVNDLRQAKMDRIVAALANRNKNVSAPEDNLLTSTDGSKHKDNGKLYGWTAGSDSQQLFMLVNAEVLKQAQKDKGFTMSSFDKAGGFLEKELYNRVELQDAVLDYSYGFDDSLDGVAVLCIDGEVAWDHEIVTGRDDVPARDGQYLVTHRNRTSDQTGLETEDYLDMGLKRYRAPGMSSAPLVEFTLPNLTFVLKNGGDFDDMPGGRIKKEWNERDFRRDELGRFADKPSSGVTLSQVPAKTDLKRKQAMKARKRKMVDDRNQLKMDAGRASLMGAMQAQTVNREKPVVLNTETSLDSRLLAQEKAQAMVEAKVAARVEERVAARLEMKIAAAQRKGEDRKESLDDFRWAHEDWKELEAVRFSEDSDMGTFMTIFGYDPYENMEAFDPDIIDDSERAEAMSLFNPRSVTALVDRMSEYPNSYLGPPIEVEGRGLAASAPQALYVAGAEAEELNKASDSVTSEWMPMAQLDTETNFPFYRSFVVQVARRDEDIVVLGSKADWAAVKAGKHVSLEALPGYDSNPDQPGQGRFDELFYATANNEAVAKYVDSYSRSDFYVRAFRINT